MSERKKPTDLALVANLDAGQVLETPASAYEQLLDKVRSRSRSGSEVLSMPPVRWIIPSWLPEDSSVALYAAAGVGKSFVALTLALEMARGGWFLGKQLEPVPVLYVAAERGTTLRDRAEAWSLHHGAELPQAFTLDSFEASPLQLTNADHLEVLCQRVRDTGARLVVLDTFARMALGLEENSAKDMGPALQALEQLREATEGGTVLVVHHSGKDSSKGLRGSSALLGAFSLTLRLSGSEGHLKLEVDKDNLGPAPWAAHFQLETVGLPTLDGEGRASAVLVGGAAPARNPGLEEAVVRLLGDASAGSLSMAQLLEALEEEGHKVSRATLDRSALKGLLEAGKVLKQGQSSATRYRLP